MKRGMSLSQRILLVFGGLTLLGGAALILIAGTRLQAATLEFFQQDLQNRVITAASSLGLGGESEEGGTRLAAVQSQIDALSQRTGYDFLLVDGFGRLVIPSTAPEYASTFPGQLFQQAAQDGIASATVSDPGGQERAYAITRIRQEENGSGFLVISSPTDRAYVEARSQWLALLAVALPVIAGVAAASVWMGRSIVRPLRQMEDSALRMADGHLDTRITVHSTHEINALANAFNRMAEQLETLIGQQRSFVSNAAHELRRPLMAIRLRLEAIETGGLTPEQQEAYLRELDAESARMAGLVTSLLTLARLDEGHLHSPPEAYDAAAVMQDAARHWRIQAQRAGLEFQAAIPEEAPTPALPAESLRMVLDNLLSNAVKYTAHGHVRLEVGADARALHLIVSDTGEGFDPAEQGRLFERFFRSTRERPATVEGTGLGLAIVAALVAQADGTVSASSPSPGQGATFRVDLPVGK
ncbi:MAG: HAMP domain-containing histidine kinase [Anaerolineae bacterium]|nr:HAMP domain-containing histidine kinase [Anaerolineae bacterium]